MFKLILRVSMFFVLAGCVAMGQSSKSSARANGSFVGRWECGTGAGKATFFITLDRDGKATKTIGSPNGKWVVKGDEAQITWDDGWHDVIRRAGNHWEKAAYAPGKSFSDTPDNITSANNTEPL